MTDFLTIYILALKHLTKKSRIWPETLQTGILIIFLKFCKKENFSRMGNFLGMSQQSQKILGIPILFSYILFSNVYFHWRILKKTTIALASSAIFDYLFSANILEQKFFSANWWVKLTFILTLMANLTRHVTLVKAFKVDIIKLLNTKLKDLFYKHQFIRPK